MGKKWTKKVRKRDKKRSEDGKSRLHVGTMNKRCVWCGDGDGKEKKASFLRQTKK